MSLPAAALPQKAVTVHQPVLHQCASASFSVDLKKKKKFVLTGFVSSLYWVPNLIKASWQGPILSGTSETS